MRTYNNPTHFWAPTCYCIWGEMGAQQDKRKLIKLVERSIRISSKLRIMLLVADPSITIDGMFFPLFFPE